MARASRSQACWPGHTNAEQPVKRIPGATSQSRARSQGQSVCLHRLSLLTLNRSGSVWKLERQELNQGFLSAVTTAGVQLQDPGVAAGTVCEGRADFINQLPGDCVVLDLAANHSTGMQVATACGGNQLLDVRLQVLGLGQGGFDAAVPEQSGGLSPRQCDPVAAVAV